MTPRHELRERLVLSSWDTSIFHEVTSCLALETYETKTKTSASGEADGMGRPVTLAWPKKIRLWQARMSLGSQ